MIEYYISYLRGLFENMHCENNAQGEGSDLEVLIDTKKMACPMPIIKLKKSLAQNSQLDCLFMIELTDKGGLHDIPAFCQQQGLECELVNESPYITFKVWRTS